MATPVAHPSSDTDAACASELAAAIDDLLPQTQCGQCGYAGCRPYAEALARGSAELNRCAPGGQVTLEALAVLLRRPVLPLDPACAPARAAQLVAVDEALCIGCTKCIAACPVDAIVGAPGRTHTVLRSLCTGCALCLPPCPVDCIRVLPDAATVLPVPLSAAARRAADERRARHQARRVRHGHLEGSVRTPMPPAVDRRAVIAEAIARTRARRRPRTCGS